MQTAETIKDVRMLVGRAKSAGKRIGLVLTMGALHEGHFSLITRAKAETDFVVVSIFVNPAQFGPGEDIEKYPRTVDDDIAACKKLGVDIVFAPAVEQMYPQENLTWVTVEKLSENLCGKSRPGHFRGVATVCTKLFNIVCPDAAFFGQKDAQQSVVIKKMVSDLNMPVDIIICPTVREPDGLAKSSRNKYLTAEQRKAAPLLYAALQQAEVLIAAGVRDSAEIVGEMKKTIKIVSLIDIEYISICSADSLEEIKKVSGTVLIALAARLGTARLIDNIIVDAD